MRREDGVVVRMVLGSGRRKVRSGYRVLRIGDEFSTKEDRQTMLSSMDMR
jgi:hypothetical protein